MCWLLNEPKDTNERPLQDIKMGFVLATSARNRTAAKNETITSSVAETKTTVLCALEVSAALRRRSGIRGTGTPAGAFVIQLHGVTDRSEASHRRRQGSPIPAKPPLPTEVSFLPSFLTLTFTEAKSRISRFIFILLSVRKYW